MIDSTSARRSLRTRIPVIEILTDVIRERARLTSGEEIRRIGRMDVLAARLDLMSKIVNRDVTEILTDGKGKIAVSSGRMNAAQRTRMVVLCFEKMANQDVPDSKEDGSAMIIPIMDTMLRKRNRRYEIGNGAVTGMVRTVTGLGAASLSRVRSGWIQRSLRSHGGCIRRKTLSAGKKE